VKTTDAQEESPLVSSTPAQVPHRTTLEGERVYIVPLDPDRHGDSLFQGSGGPQNEELWKYLSDGPFWAIRGGWSG
jgi:hypothetical protein